MGSTGVRASTPDPFATALTQERASPLPQNSAATTVPIPRHVLPNDLPSAIKQLKDQELDLLLSAVLAEKKRRGKEYSDSNEGLRKRRIEPVSVPLTQGKLNAIRAAFKAGVTPSRIARQSWLRYQPNSKLSLWWHQRFGGKGMRERKVGIVALARKLAIALWRFVEQGVVPEGATLKV